MINKKEEINKSQQVKEKNRSSNKQPIKQIQRKGAPQGGVKGTKI